MDDFDPSPSNQIEDFETDEWQEDDIATFKINEGGNDDLIKDEVGGSHSASTRKKLTIDFPSILGENPLYFSDDSDIDDVSTPSEIQTPSDLELDDDSDDDDNDGYGSTLDRSGIDLEWDNDNVLSQTGILDENLATSSEATKTADASRTVVIGKKNYKLDMTAIEPYRKVLSHGGYCAEGLTAIIVFSPCYLPDRTIHNWLYTMENMFLYIVSTLDLLVANDYMVVYFNGGCTKKNHPPLSWLKKCYAMIEHHLRKNMKRLIIVHPTWHIKLILGFFKPFTSSKFKKKISIVSDLHKLADIVPLTSVNIPESVQNYDVKLITKRFLKQNANSSNSSKEDLK